MTDATALRALKRGSEEALEWFIDRYTGYVAAVVNNIIGGSHSREDVEEVCSDAFVALWQSSEDIRGSSVKAWLARVARNKAIDLMRRDGDKPLPLDEDSLAVPVSGPEDEISKACDQWAVREAVLSMKQPLREIFLRHYYYFQRIEDISEAMDIPANTVKTHLRRGREKLRTALQNEYSV